MNPTHHLLQTLDLDDDTVTDPTETRWAWLYGIGLSLALLGFVFEVFVVVVCKGRAQTAGEAGAILALWGVTMIGLIVRMVAEAALSFIDQRERWRRVVESDRRWRSPAGARLWAWAMAIPQPTLAAQLRRLSALVSRSIDAERLQVPDTLRLGGPPLGPLVDDDVPYIGGRYVTVAWPIGADRYVSFAIDEEPRMSHWEVFDAKRDLCLAIGPLASRDVPIDRLVHLAVHGTDGLEEIVP